MGTTTNARATVHRDVAALERMTPSQLRERYQQVFGEPTRAGNAVWLRRRIAWRLQCLAEGDLVERADRLRERALSMACDSDLRVTPPRMPPAQTRTVVGRIGPQARPTTTAATNAGLTPGTTLTRNYRGKRLDVLVLDPPNGFEFDGRRYRSLSAIARAITGAQWNGRLFFGLTGTGSRAKEACA